MNVTQQAVAALLKSAVTGESIPLPEGFNLEDAASLIEKHNMESLIFEGAMLCGVPMSDPTMKDLYRAYGKGFLISERQMAELRRVYDAFDAHGIEYLPLKGANMKFLYRKPELRTMVDADILIRTEQYDAIRPLMVSLGYSEGEETDHELVWKKDALYLELHKCLIPSYNKDYYAYFGDGWNLANKSNGTRYAMTPEDEWLYLFTHFAKHFRDGGIGCRHVVDLWVYLNAHPDLEDTPIEKALEQMQLGEFYHNVRRMLGVWFEAEPSDEKLECMTEFIFNSGSWGFFASRAMSRMVRDSKHSSARGDGKLLYVLTTLFPGIHILKGKYTILRKAPFLLPFVWIYRIFVKTFIEREAWNAHNRYLNRLSREKLDERQQMLNYVGLDYNF